MSKRSDRRQRNVRRIETQLVERAMGMKPDAPLPPQVLAAYGQITKSFSGPLPPPEILREYDELVPGSAKTFIDTFSDQAHHRMDLEKTHLRSDRRRSWGGLIAGFVVAMTALCGGIWLVYMGHDTAGATIGTVGLGGLVGTFVYGTKSQRTERIEKAKLMVRK